MSSCFVVDCQSVSFSRLFGHIGHSARDNNRSRSQKQQSEQTLRIIYCWKKNHRTAQTGVAEFDATFCWCNVRLSTDAVYMVTAPGARRTSCVERACLANVDTRALPPGPLATTELLLQQPTVKSARPRSDLVDGDWPAEPRPPPWVAAVPWLASPIPHRYLVTLPGLRRTLCTGRTALPSPG